MLLESLRGLGVTLVTQFHLVYHSFSLIHLLSFIQRLLKEMEEFLGCWWSFLLPPSLDPELSKQAQNLCKSLSEKGVAVSEEMLTVCVAFVFNLPF